MQHEEKKGKGSKQTRRARFDAKTRDKIKEGTVFGPYLLNRMEEADVLEMQFCRLADHMYAGKFRSIIRGEDQGLSTLQLVQFADITRSDPVEMIFMHMKDQGYWQDTPVEELRAKAITTYLSEIVPKLREDQQRALNAVVKEMAKVQGIVK